MKRNILILEDKKSHREALCKILSNIGQDIEIHLAENVQTAYYIAMERHIHLFLVDIILSPNDPGNVNGMDFAQSIRGIIKYQFTPLIFITSLEDPTFCSYTQLHCFSYIEKPFDPKKVQKVISKALEFPVVDDVERFVYFRKDGIIYSKCIKDVIYVEIARRKIVIHCKDDVLEIPYKTCEEIMRDLDSSAFIRCSRYGIINVNYIEEIDYTNRYIKMKHIKEPVEIGIIMKTKFREAVEEKK